ncbi:MAG TPA: 2'-5' RNA ligase family protein [Dehalococcoidia bacterium]|nr:2'-5' RNA ligase family protein [Dehalococcoidia bacterium]
MGEEMHGVVGVPDARHEKQIRDLWAGMEAEFGWPPVSDTLVPHFSYHVATDYNLDLLRERLVSLARRTKPFAVGVGGIGIFTANDDGQEIAVCYLPMIRNNALNGMHHAVWTDLADTAGDINERYAADVWVPHITVTPDGLTREVVPALAEFLTRQPIDWELQIDRITLLHDTGQRQELVYHVLFGSGEVVDP